MFPEELLKGKNVADFFIVQYGLFDEQIKAENINLSVSNPNESHMIQFQPNKVKRPRGSGQQSMGILPPNNEAATLSPNLNDPLVRIDGAHTAMNSAKASQESQRARKPAFAKTVDSKTSGGKSEKWVDEKLISVVDKSVKLTNSSPRSLFSDKSKLAK